MFDHYDTMSTLKHKKFIQSSSLSRKRKQSDIKDGNESNSDSAVPVLTKNQTTTAESPVACHVSSLPLVRKVRFGGSQYIDRTYQSNLSDAETLKDCLNDMWYTVS